MVAKVLLNRDCRANKTGAAMCPFLVATLVMRIFMLVTLTMFLSNTARADDISLVLNGKAIHTNEKEGVQYNENNWGGGLQYDFNTVSARWVPFVSASVFQDSNGNPSYYGGGGISRRYIISHRLNHLHVDGGIAGFLMGRKDYNDGALFPGILPVISMGTDKVSLNVTYVPEINRYITPLWFFQLKISAKNFLAP